MKNKIYPERFNNAVTKLYVAFHANKLDAYDCEACAVGNICNNNSEWATLMYNYKMPSEEILLSRHPNIEETNTTVEKSGYSIYELAKIESIFLKCFKPKNDSRSKETQFLGLCAVIAYLCELDNIPNIMEIQSLFETDGDKAKHELQSVLLCQ